MPKASTEKGKNERRQPNRPDAQRATTPVTATTSRNDSESDGENDKETVRKRLRVGTPEAAEKDRQRRKRKERAYTEIHDRAPTTARKESDRKRLIVETRMRDRER